MKKKHDPRSEAAQRAALKLHAEGKAIRAFVPGKSCVEFRDYNKFNIIATFDLRDCYRKRQPLKGITKAVRKAVQPRRKK